MVMQDRGEDWRKNVASYMKGKLVTILISILAHTLLDTWQARANYFWLKGVEEMVFLEEPETGLQSYHQGKENGMVNRYQKETYPR